MPGKKEELVERLFAAQQQEGTTPAAEEAAAEAAAPAAEAAAPAEEEAAVASTAEVAQEPSPAPQAAEAPTQEGGKRKIVFDEKVAGVSAVPCICLVRCSYNEGTGRADHIGVFNLQAQAEKKVAVIKPAAKPLPALKGDADKLKERAERCVDVPCTHPSMQAAVAPRAQHLLRMHLTCVWRPLSFVQVQGPCSGEAEAAGGEVRRGEYTRIGVGGAVCCSPQ